MPEFAKTYDFGDMHKAPTIDGEPFPYHVSADPMPMVEATEFGHILWIPVLVDAPMPSPPEGRPSGEQLAAINLRDKTFTIYRRPEPEEQS